MNPRHLELADEFSKLVGKPHLLDYLGLGESASADEARAELKKRRKYMQGMQSNPKFKGEALFLIKNFGALDALLQDPVAYIEAVGRQQESEHLPILEMTIRTVLKAGSLNAEQEDYLRRQARELGLSDATFEDTLTRLAAQSGVARSEAVTGKPDDDDGAIDDNVEITDHYGILGIRTNASREEVYDAYRVRYRTVRAMADREKAEELYRRLDRAWQVLSDQTARDTYDLSLRNTGPPARTRKRDDPFLEALRQAPTAPPVRARTHHPDGTTVTPVPTPASAATRNRIEFVGARVRPVSLTGEVFATTLPLKMHEAIEARVTTDEPWLHVEPARLEAGKREHTLQVRIDPRDVPAKKATAVVTVQTEQGDRASLVFEIQRKRSPAPLIAGVLGIAGLGAALAALGATQGWFAPPDRSVTIVVDPTSEDILLDGASAGTGSQVVLSEPPGGTVTVTVLQPNFTTWIQPVDFAAYAGGVLAVRLDLASDLSFRPTAEMKQGTVDEEVLQQVMPPRTKAMDDCARRAAGAEPIEGSVRIFVGRDGVAMGVETEGGGASDPEVRDCLVRQAAAVRLPAVADGDYAIVRYHYVVAEGSP